MTRRFELSTRSHDVETIVTVKGDIDMDTAPELRELLTELVDAAHYRLLLDLTGVGFCDSVGLGVMVGTLKRIRSRDPYGHVRIVCQGGVLRVFELTALTRVFPVHATLSDALTGTTASTAGAR